MNKSPSLWTHAAWFALASAVVLTTWSAPSLAQTRYTASWASLDTHNPAPEWFQDAKFGIYYHWGAFATAMHANEWYPRLMYQKGGDSYNFNTTNFGDPYSDWPYNKFIDGGTAKNGKVVQFAPKLKSAGGVWDPDEWADLVVGAGVKFAGPVGEHHDGFSMWDSKVNEWNSVDKGPKLDLVGLQLAAYRKRGVKVMVSLHHAYNINGYYDTAPMPSDPSLQKLFGKLPKAEEQQLWLDKIKEVITLYKPDLIWQDFALNSVDEAKRLDFLATFYNMGIDENKDVVATAKDGITAPHKGQILDFERGGPASITTPYWLTDDAVSSSSWGYTTGLRYYATNALIHSFLDRVSKGGNLLLNLSPLPEGTFPQEQKDILAAFGKFLKQNGTAVYNTRTFSVYGEGPTKLGGGGMGQPTAMTASDIRYTRSKDGDAVYALIMGWPGNGKQVTMSAITASTFALGSGKVFLFGPTGDGTGEIELAATQDGSGLHVTLPANQPYTSVAYALKISKSGKAPEKTDWTPDKQSVPGTGGASGSGGNTGAGGAVATGGRTGAGGATADAGGLGGASGGGGTAGGTAGTTGNGGSSGTSDSGAGGNVANAGGASASGGHSSGGAVTGSGGSAGGSNAGGATSSGSGGHAGGGGSVTATDSNGCSCHLQSGGRSSVASGLLFFGALLAARRRRSAADRRRRRDWN